jgi:plasmid stability protein
MGFFATPSKIDKNCLQPYVATVAYPKQNPDKVAKSAGISLPADIKAAATEMAAKSHQSLSAYVREMLRAELQSAGYKIEQSGQANLRRAKSVEKKRR